MLATKHNTSQSIRSLRCNDVKLPRSIQLHRQKKEEVWTLDVNTYAETFINCWR